MKMEPASTARRLLWLCNVAPDIACCNSIGLSPARALSTEKLDNSQDTAQDGGAASLGQTFLWLFQSFS